MLSESAALAILPDFPDERWPSMDLCAEMLLAAWPAASMWAERLCPPFRRRLPHLSGRGFNADRLCNRHWDYPRFLRRRRQDFAAFHVVDHSYAQLVHVLPAERTGVYCHDLDAFRCLLEPAREPRPWWFRAMMRRVLSGMRKAALVFVSTDVVWQALVQARLIEPARLVLAPYGIAAEFTEPAQEPPADSLLTLLRNRPFLLHVGSCIPRKRIDVLLAVFAEVRRQWPELALVQVGGEWTPAQAELVRQLDLAPHIEQMRGIGRAALAGLYRRAAVVLLPSEAEGFGLPVIEALACGATVVASDLPTLREVGGPAVAYCPVADVGAWADAVGGLLARPGAAPPRDVRLVQAGRYSWANHARIIADAYQRLLA